VKLAAAVKEGGLLMLGRSEQIRVHLSHLKLVGPTTYRVLSTGS
jgi:chemotaxis methyl-accepting protein methylase